MPQLSLILIAANFFGAAAFRALKPNLATAFMMAFVVIGTTGYLGAEYGDHVLAILNRGRDHVLAATTRTPAWPPQRGLRFPDQSFVDRDGESRTLDEFRGRVLLVHTIGMPSGVCVAFAGGGTRGMFEGVAPSSGLDSIATYAWRFGRVRLDDERLVVVHLILFNRKMAAPSAEEIRQWERHFEIDRHANQIVLGGSSALASPTSRKMVPGFLLLDQHSVVRADATGTDPADDLYLKLLPMIGRLLGE